jgi:hypothetical protein
MRDQDRLIEWLNSNELLKAEAAEIADGDEFYYGDYELGENAYGWLYSTIADEWLSGVAGVDLRERDAVAASMDKSEFLSIDWTEVREKLLGESV